MSNNNNGYDMNDDDDDELSGFDDLDFNNDSDHNNDDKNNSDEDNQQARELLVDYYGISLNEDNQLSNIEKNDQPSQPKPITDTDRLDLDSQHFDSEMYVSRLLKRKPLQELVDLDAQMNTSVNHLDSDMQRLVYENYNKFISATDMIRQMKTHVESMEEEMTRLSKNMENISTSCESLEVSLDPNRARVEKLVGVNRLIHRLEFIFELPARLTESIEMGAYAQAVKYFTQANGILKQYNHMASFEKIRIESEKIIRKLKSTLQQTIRNPKINPLQQMENSALLMQLGEPSEDLLHDIITARRRQLEDEINNCVEKYKQMKDDLEKRRRLKINQAVASKQTNNARKDSLNDNVSKENKDITDRGDEVRNELLDSKIVKKNNEDDSVRNELLGDRAVEKNEDDSLRNELLGNKVSKKSNEDDSLRNELLGDKASKNNNEDDSLRNELLGDKIVENDESGSNENVNKAEERENDDEKEEDILLIDVLADGFFTSFVLFAESFRQTFLTLDKKSSRVTIQKCAVALTELTKDIFGVFFDILRQELLDMSDQLIIESDLGGVETFKQLKHVLKLNITERKVDNNNKENKSLNATQVGVMQILTALQKLIRYITKPVKLVPHAELQQKSEELVRLCIRHSVENLMDRCKQSIERLIRETHSYLEIDRQPQPPSLFYKTEVSNDLIQSHLRWMDNIRKLSHISTQVAQVMEKSLRLTVPLVSAHTYLPTNNKRIEFGDLVHTNVEQLLISLEKICGCGLLFENMGIIHDGKSPHLFNDLSTLKTRDYPIFFLLLSRLSHELLKSNGGGVGKFLKTCFPGRSSYSATILERNIPKAISTFAQTSQGLLQYYVESNGYNLTKLIRKRQLMNEEQDEIVRQKVIEDVVIELNMIHQQLESVFSSETSQHKLNRLHYVNEMPKIDTSTNASDVHYSDMGLRTPSAQGKHKFANDANKYKMSRDAVLRRDMERLFTQKVQITGTAKANVGSLLHGICKMVYKSLLEDVRNYRLLTSFGHRQLQVDVAFLRYYIPEPIVSEDKTQLEQLLDEVLSSANDRII